MDANRLKALVPVNQEPSIADRVNGILDDLINIQTQFSTHPSINEQAGYFSRVFHDWKLQRYVSISGSEAMIAANNSMAASSILQTITQASMFVKNIQEQASLLEHQQRMREAEYQMKMAEVSRANAEASKIDAEAQLILMEVEDRRREV